MSRPFRWLSRQREGAQDLTDFLGSSAVVAITFAGLTRAGFRLPG
jgi:hypothetical protein